MYESEPDEPDLLLAMSYLLIYLAKNHCFGDGNKRAAWAAVLHVAELNGLAIVAETSEAVAIVNDVAIGTANLPEVARWTAAHLVAADVTP